MELSMTRVYGPLNDYFFNNRLNVSTYLYIRTSTSRDSRPSCVTDTKRSLVGEYLTGGKRDCMSANSTNVTG